MTRQILDKKQASASADALLDAQRNRHDAPRDRRRRDAWSRTRTEWQILAAFALMAGLVGFAMTVIYGLKPAGAMLIAEFSALGGLLPGSLAICWRRIRARRKSGRRFRSAV